MASKMATIEISFDKSWHADENILKPDGQKHFRPTCKKKLSDTKIAPGQGFKIEACPRGPATAVQ